MAFVHQRGQAAFKPASRPFSTGFLDDIGVSEGKFIEYTQFVDSFQIAKVAGPA
jgi:ketosteroid isomerase-like protein